MYRFCLRELRNKANSVRETCACVLGVTCLVLDEWDLTIGRIVAPFGLLGEMKVQLETDFPERFAKMRQICLRKPDGTAELRPVESTRLHKKQVLLRLPGVGKIEQAEELRGCLVQVKRQDAVRLPANEFYIHDLVGCEVVTVEGRVLGPLISVLRGPGNDVYVIGEGKSEILLPAIKEVVRDVDMTARRIIVAPTPGLLGDAD